MAPAIVHDRPAPDDLRRRYMPSRVTNAPHRPELDDDDACPIDPVIMAAIAVGMTPFFHIKGRSTEPRPTKNQVSSRDLVIGDW